jgi:hypothetical protein
VPKGTRRLPRCFPDRVGRANDGPGPWSIACGYPTPRKTQLATIKPTALIGLYPNPELKGVAEEVEATLVLIMNEAAR